MFASIAHNLCQIPRALAKPKAKFHKLARQLHFWLTPSAKARRRRAGRAGNASQSYSPIHSLAHHHDQRGRAQACRPHRLGAARATRTALSCRRLPTAETSRRRLLGELARRHRHWRPILQAVYFLSYINKRPRNIVKRKRQLQLGLACRRVCVCPCACVSLSR